MEEFKTPAEIEAMAKQAGISVAEVCRRAGVAPSTFTRWKGGSVPSTRTYGSLVRAAENAFDERVVAWSLASVA